MFFIEIYDYFIVNILWYSVFVFCNWLCNLIYKNYCLLMEVEWEKVVCGEYVLFFFWGNKWEINYVNIYELRLEKIIFVNNFLNVKSLYGLLNMFGNVYEWISSLWDMIVYNYFYILNDDCELLERLFDVLCVICGGLFFWNKKYVRCVFCSFLCFNRFC